ncbi:hypothetical protein GCM10011390_24560 [Aureimonas endophytica]|uniref:Uncharacterized protein n=1 Tax=Aureimonas endophytica TaxID=2027858 RepID=A0A916ZN03_9HYPH|nr:hypothetical protein GCM10011390_24560 [Aureimonas endophytica]
MAEEARLEGGQRPRQHIRPPGGGDADIDLGQDHSPDLRVPAPAGLVQRPPKPIRRIGGPSYPGAGDPASGILGARVRNYNLSYGNEPEHPARPFDRRVRPACRATADPRRHRHSRAGATPEPEEREGASAPSAFRRMVAGVL